MLKTSYAYESQISTYQNQIVRWRNKTPQKNNNEQNMQNITSEKSNNKEQITKHKFICFGGNLYF